MNDIKRVVKINLLMCEECAKYIPDKFLRNFRVDNNLEPFYFYCFEDKDYENNTVSLVMDKAKPEEITIFCDSEETVRCIKKFQELNKHITFEEDSQLSWQDNKHTIIFKVKLYGIK